MVRNMKPKLPSMRELISKALDKQLVEQLNNGTTAIDTSGELVTVSPTAALLNVARQRVKDIRAANPDPDDDPIQSAIDRLSATRKIEATAPAPVPIDTDNADDEAHF